MFFFKKVPALLFMSLLAAASAAVGAKVIKTPPTLPGVTVVKAEEAKRLVDQGMLIVDVRVPMEYAEQHIQGAVNIPYKEKSGKSVDFDPRIDEFNLQRLPPDKATPIIFYCNAGECWKSYKAARVAQKAGYTRIYWLREGIPGWKSKGLPVE